MDFSLKILGTASAAPVSSRNQSAQVLKVHERFFLIDCGEGTQQQIRKFKLPLMKIDSVFISHIHGDHIFGIFGLLSTFGLHGRTQPLNIYAAPNFAPILKFFLSYYGEGLSYEIRFTPLTMKSPEEIYSTKTLSVSAFPLNHRIETFGFRFSEKEPMLNIYKDFVDYYKLSLSEIGRLKQGGDIIRPDGEVILCSRVCYKPYEPRSYAYVSDTAPFDELASWVQGVDLLYHESTYLSEDEQKAAERHHSTSLQAAKCALDAKVGRLVIGHYSSSTREPEKFEDECRTVFENSFAAKDGDFFDIPFVKNS